MEINGQYRGYFSLPHNYRKGISDMIGSLRRRFKIFLLSGDNEAEKENLTQIFGDKQILLFNQTPHDKLKFIRSIQQSSNPVLMIGDGLNDAGALKQSDTGISVADDINTFTPASDGIMDASHLRRLEQFMKFSRIIEIMLMALLRVD